MKITRRDRWIMGFAGLLLLAGAAAKFVRPQDIVAAVLHAMSPLSGLSERIVFVLVAVLIVFEVGLGVALVVKPSRRCVQSASLMFIGFAVVLLARFTSVGSPPCGCLSAWFTSKGEHAVWLDIVRNVALAAALLATGEAWRTSETRQAAVVGAVRANGFTLIEVLVSVGVISILTALVFPAFYAARDAGKSSLSLQTQGQLAKVLATYAGDFRDCFPFLSPRERENGTIVVHGVTFPYSHVTVHTQFWVYALDGYSDETVRAAVGKAIAAPASPPDPLGVSSLAASRYFLTPTASLDPALFREPLATAIPLPDGMLRAVRHSEMLTPSGKGLTWDTELFSRPGVRSLLACSFGDGSTGVLSPQTDPRLTVVSSFAAPGILCVSTRDGIRGRDR